MIFILINTCQKSVFLVIQRSVTIRNTRRNQFRHTTFYNFLRKFRIFQLVADSHTHSGTNQLGQICIKSMVWKSSQFNGFSRSICTFGKGNSKHLRCPDGIRRESFVKITATKKQNRIRMLCFNFVELLHHRRFYNIIGHKKGI